MRATRARSPRCGCSRASRSPRPSSTARALPLATITGVDTNGNRENNDLTVKAYQFTKVGQAPKEIGDCKTYNCSRGAWRTQANIRVSYDIKIKGSARITAIGEVFNLFNAKNPGVPAGAEPDERGVHAAQRVRRRLPAERTARWPRSASASRSSSTSDHAGAATPRRRARGLYGRAAALRRARPPRRRGPARPGRADPR